MIYGNSGDMARYDQPRFKWTPQLVRRVMTLSSRTRSSTLAIWQYNTCGSVAGIDTGRPLTFCCHS